MYLFAVSYYYSFSDNNPKWDYVNADCWVAVENYYLYSNPTLLIRRVIYLGNSDPLFREISDFYNDPNFFEYAM